MATIEGENLVCDVCGRTVFLKYIETKEYDGGYTMVRVYEEKPEGWTYTHLFKRTVDLCPSCAERIRTEIESVLRKIQEEDE